MITRLAFFGVFVIHFFNVSAQGKSIKTDLVYKVNEAKKSDSKSPVIILLHGYGSNEEDLFDISKSFDERFITFSLRAPFPAPSQGYSWFKLDFLPEKKFKYDYKQAAISRSKILSFISNACKSYEADSTRVFIMGYSQGAIMCYDIALNNPGKIKGVVALSGLIMPESKKKTYDLKLSALKFFIAHGTMDNVVSYHDGESAAKYLQTKSKNVSFKSYEMPHAINGKELNDIKSWLRSNISPNKK